MVLQTNELVTKIVRNQKTIFRYMFIPQMLAGFCFLVLGYYMGHDHFRLITSGVRTDGRVVGFKELSMGSGRSYSINGIRYGSSSLAFTPIVEFRNKNQTLRFRDWFGTSSQAGQNTVVPVIYDSGNPSIAMIDRPVANWLPWAPTFLLGVFLCLVAVKGWLGLSTQKG